MGSLSGVGSLSREVWFKGGFLSRGVSVQGDHCQVEVRTGGSLSSCQGWVSVWESLSMESLPEGLGPGGSLSGRPPPPYGYLWAPQILQECILVNKCRELLNLSEKSQKSQK